MSVVVLFADLSRPYQDEASYGHDSIQVVNLGIYINVTTYKTKTKSLLVGVAFMNYLSIHLSILFFNWKICTAIYKIN